jgi:PKD repeat protein
MSAPFRNRLGASIVAILFAVTLTGCPLTTPPSTDTGPTAAFSAAPTSGTAPLDVQFTDSSTAGTASITAWAWTFGDGGTSTSQSPSHTYTAAGTYSVKLTVTTSVGSDGETKSALISVTEEVDNSPTLQGLDTEKAMILPFTVQAAYNDDTMFFQMSWEGDKGDTHDYFRYTNGAWQREGGPRRDAQASIDNDPARGSTSVNSTIYESRVTFMLDDPTGPNAVPMFAELGCMLTCHDNSRAMPTWINSDGEVHKYLPDDDMFMGGRLDLWHHRLARSNPIGLSDDQWVGQRVNGEDDGKGGSRHGDDGTSPYSTAAFDDNTPQWVFDPATTPNGEFAFQFSDLFTSPIRYFTDGTAQFLGINAPNAVGIDYADAIAMGYVPQEGDTVPRRRLRQTVGSRGDIGAAGTTFVPSADDPLVGRWNSNIQRALATGNNDDTQLADTGLYNIAFAVHTGMVTVRDHYVSFAYSLSLDGGDADIQAVKMAGTGDESLPDFSDTTAYPVKALDLFLPGITSDEFLKGQNETDGVVYIDPLTSEAVDQVHAGASFINTMGSSCQDCHAVTEDEAFTPANGGFASGSMEVLVLQRGGVRSQTPIPPE